MRIFTMSVAAAFLLVAGAKAEARTPTQDAFHQAFVRMDAHWPNVSSHDYWLALRDAEDLAVKLSPSEKQADVEVARDLHVFQVYRNCWMALIAKEKALSEFAIGQLVLQNDPSAREAAREHFAMSVAQWDEAFRLWPFMIREKVKGDSAQGHADLVGTGHAWRVHAQHLLEETASR